MSKSTFVAWVVGAVLAGACSAPGAGTYCQSGSKYDTSYYSPTDVTQPPGTPPPAIRMVEGAPPGSALPPAPWMPKITYAPGTSAGPAPSASAPPQW